MSHRECVQYCISSLVLLIRVFTSGARCLYHLFPWIYCADIITMYIVIDLYIVFQYVTHLLEEYYSYMCSMGVCVVSQENSGQTPINSHVCHIAAFFRLVCCTQQIHSTMALLLDTIATASMNLQYLHFVVIVQLRQYHMHCID